jgi:ribosomal protein L12E/L44/L45/RPP1/RPP2
LALAACGGGENEVERRTDTRPTIESAVAERLAIHSDKVASLLSSGDACGAKQEAGRLRAELTTAIDDRAIPELYLEDLSGVVNELVAQIPPCEVAQPQPPPDTDRKKNERKKQKKQDKKKHDHDDDDDNDKDGE